METWLELPGSEEKVAKRSDGTSFLTSLLPHHLRPSFCMSVSQLCVLPGGLGFGFGQRLFTAPPALCLLGVPAAVVLGAWADPRRSLG